MDIGGISMHNDDLEIVRGELNQNEFVKWIGRPIPKIITFGGVILSIFGAIFIIFSLFWITTALNHSKHSFYFKQSFMDKIFPYFGLIFLAIGIAIFLSPIFIYRDTKNTIYAITDKRCIIIKLGKSKRISSYSKESVSIIDRVEREDGTGDLIFAKEQYTSTDSDTNTSTISSRNIGFYYVPKVKEVEKYLSEMINS
jgi:hypothetical protein